MLYLLKSLNFKGTVLGESKQTTNEKQNEINVLSTHKKTNRQTGPQGLAF